MQRLVLAHSLALACGLALALVLALSVGSFSFFSFFKADEEGRAELYLDKRPL